MPKKFETTDSQISSFLSNLKEANGEYSQRKEHEIMLHIRFQGTKNQTIDLTESVRALINEFAMSGSNPKVNFFGKTGFVKR